MVNKLFEYIMKLYIDKEEIIDAELEVVETKKIDYVRIVLLLLMCISLAMIVFSFFK